MFDKKMCIDYLEHLFMEQMHHERLRGKSFGQIFEVFSRTFLNVLNTIIFTPGIYHNYYDIV